MGYKFKSQLDEIFRTNFKNLRLRRGLTQDQLAHKLGFALKTRISEIERGKNSLTLQQIETICNKLKVNPLHMQTEGYYEPPEDMKTRSTRSVEHS